MNELNDMLWIEFRKALRSKMPYWTGLGSLFLPLGFAFLIFVARNPEISKQLGLVSAKADLLAFGSMDWPAYMALAGQLIAAAGLFLFILIISWIFGREFSDGTLKDLLAVPVRRGNILLAKFIVTSVWSAALSGLILLAVLLTGTLVRLPGSSAQAILDGSRLVMLTAGMVIAVALPFALFASLGRGYLLPLGLAVLTLLMSNVVALAGWGDYFPWAVPGMYAVGTDPLPSASYWIVAATCLVGMLATYLWWKYADQS